MKANATVQENKDKKRNISRHFIYLPVRIVEKLNIHKGNVVEFVIENPTPEYIAQPKHNPKKMTAEEAPSSI